MKNETFKKVLQLDSLTNILSWCERIEIHQDKVQSPRIFAAYNWIEHNKWEVPSRNYEHSRVLCFLDERSGKWHPDEDYLKVYPEYKEELIKIKNL
jgi:hypothetical protein